MPSDTPASVALPRPRQASGSYRVLLVCMGNICRSPTAEAVLRAELARAGLDGAVAVTSAGLGDWHVGEPMHLPAQAELARRGYDGSAHRAALIDPSALDSYDLVLGMDRHNLAGLRAMARDAGTARRIALLRSFDPGLTGDDPYQGEVPDPYGGPPRDYALAFDLIHAAVIGLTRRLAEFYDSRASGHP